MANAFPDSFKDPLYAALDERTESKLGLPSGVLSSIRLNGEKSNNSQVSEASAKSPYQFIPSTRKAIIEKYGIDPLLNPENASEAAGLLLQEGLKRNNGDVAQAVGEYHGGIDRKQWGSRTNAYIARVTAGLPESPPAQAKAPSQSGGSTFDRVSASMNKPDQNSIANVYQAYQSGQMSPEDAKQFEADVNDGHMMLPRGASLKTAPAASTASEVPQAVLDAYRNGQMSAEDRGQFEADVKSGMVSLPGGQPLNAAEMIPGSASQNGFVNPTAPQRTLGEQVQGVGEAGLSAATGATGGTLGMIGGTLQGLAEQILSGNFGTKEAANLVEQSASKGMQALTYAPRGQAGQEYTENLGNAMQGLIPLGPLTAELGALGRGAAPVRQAAGDLGRAAQSVAVPAVAKAAQNVREAPQALVNRVRGEPSQVSGRVDSVGASATPAAMQRVATAESLPVPFTEKSALTKGQAGREFEQVQFEKEQAKGPNGDLLRERAANQAEVLDQNFEAMVDMANPQVIERPAIGSAIDRSVVNKANFALKRISAAYKKAKESGELMAPVDMSGVADGVSAIERFEGVAPNAKAIRSEAVRLGILGADEDGVLQGSRVSLEDAELFRQFINEATDWGTKREAFVAKKVISSIDDATEGAGGELYAEARKLRRQYAQEFENSSLTRKILGTKPGTNERSIAVEDLYDRIIIGASVQEMNKLRSTLISAGPEGKQAWANVKAKVISEIKERATSKSQSDMRGRPIVSPDRLNREIAALDRDGRLESLFGKRHAQAIRDLGEIANALMTAPPGSVNHSNTASALMVALDSLGTFAVTGIPAPVATALREGLRHVKNRKVRARIKDSLSENTTPKF